MKLLHEYQEKRRLAEEAVRLVRNGQTIVVPTGVGEPPTLLAALAAQRREFLGVTVAQLLPLRKFDYFDPATVEHVRHLSYFFSAATRSGGQAGWIDEATH
jgi:acyl-CoA hydrolase